MGKKSYDELNELEKFRWDFWNTLRQYLLETRSFLRPGDSDYGHWLNLKLGEFKGMSPLKKHFTINQYITIFWVEGSKAQAIGDCRSYYVRATYDSLNDKSDNATLSQRWFKFMREREKTIHYQLGFELDWDNSRNIEVYLKSRRVVADFRNLDAWPGYINDMRIQAEHLHTAFQPRALAFTEACHNR